MSDLRTQLVLGGLKFEVGKNAFEELEESYNYKWNSLERSNERPALQFQAEQPKTIDFSGTLSTVDSGLKTFDEIRAKAAEGEPLTLVDGLGRVHGKFVITSLKMTSSSFVTNNIPRVILFRVSLTEYERA